MTESMDKFQQTPVADLNSAQIVRREYVCSKCRNLEEQPPTTYQDGSSNLEQVVSKLRLHYVPRETETTDILSTIQTEKAILENVKQDLTRLEAIIQRLEAQRKELELNVKCRSALLAPIRRLPDEILSEIFLFSSHGKVDVCSPQSAIWRIEQVCTRWRGVAMSLQEVWSSIEVNLGCLTPYNAAVPIATVDRLVSRCLQRSGERPLTIKFFEIGLPAHFEAILHLLSRCSNRWENLSFSLSMFENPQEFKHGLSMLKSLELRGNYKGFIPMDSFNRAERLSRLRLHGVSRPLYHLTLPWSQIQYLDVSYCNFWPREFTDMLALMPNLSTLLSKWNKRIGQTNHPHTLSQVRLRHLRLFHFEAALSDIYTTLPPLYMPALSDLSIHCGKQNASNTDYSYISDAIVEFIRCSHCSLTTLSLASVDSACVSRILASTPTLRNLSLSYIQNVQYNVQELSQPAAMVPLLETFHLTCKNNQGNVTIRPLVEFIQNRSQPQQSCPILQKLDLTFGERRGVDDFVELLVPVSLYSGISVTIHSLAA